MGSLTSFGDRWISSEASIAYGTEFIGGAVELPIDLFLKGIAAKAAKLGIGIGTLLAAHFGKNYVGFLRNNPRLRTELHEIAAHMLTRSVDPSPPQMQEIAQQIEEIRQRARFGASWKDQFKAMTFSPQEVADSINALAGTVGLGRGRSYIREETAQQRTRTATQVPEIVEISTGPGVTAALPSVPYGLELSSTGR